MSNFDGEFDITVRKAEKVDMVHVFQMIKELASFDKLEDQVKIDHRVLEADGFNENSPLFGCFVAETPDNTIIGYALYAHSYCSWEGKSIFLEDLYVKSTYRRHGIGKKLFLTVMKTAQDSGISVVHFHVSALNSAIDFYKKMGAVNLSETENWTLFKMDNSSLQNLI